MYPEENTARMLPEYMKKKIPPAKAWLRANSSSMRGSSGDITRRTEKLRNQRHQKTKRRKIFME
jgi:hypothetical protein